MVATITLTETPTVVIPEHILTDLDDPILFAAYVRLKWRCAQSPIRNIYEATKESLERLWITGNILCQLRARNLIYWDIRPDIQHIQMVERRSLLGKICSNCGASNPPTNGICDNCGAAI